MGLTTRILLREDSGQWHRISMGKALFLMEAGTSQRELKGRIVEVAFAQIEVAGPRTIRLVRADREIWQFDANGALDKKARGQYLWRRLWPVGWEDLERTRSFSESDLQTIREFLGLGK